MMRPLRQLSRIAWRHRWSILLVWATLLPNSARAGSGNIASLPQPRTKAPSGLRLDIDNRWVDGNGYRPVRVRLSLLNGRPTPADRTVKVLLRPRSWYWSNSEAAVSAWVQLEQGNTFGETVISIPQSGPWVAVDVKTWEAGKLVKELSRQVSITTTVNGTGQWTEAAPTILFVDSDAPVFDPIRSLRRTVTATGAPVPPAKRALPDIRSLASHFQLLEYGASNPQIDFDVTKPVDDGDTLSFLTNLGKMEVLPPAALPDRWINYTNVDVMFVSFADLQEVFVLSKTWEAVRRWLAAGGTLCVYDLGADFSRLETLEQTLGLGPLPGHQEVPHRAWNVPQPSDYRHEIRAAEDVQWGLRGAQMNGAGAVAFQTVMRGNQWVTASVDETGEDETGEDETGEDGTGEDGTSMQPPNAVPFVWRPAECGHLVAMAAENPFPGQREDWAWLFNSLDDHDWMWYRRHGISRSRKNPDFWNWMIPGVGAAPVNSFLVLISLFVLLIGPLNYVLLRRYRRLHLLLLFVPLGAGAVTAALFLYAMLDDGLSARGRVRSLTRLDQASGRVVTWGRHAYYAGLVPSGGLTYSTETAIYPFEQFSVRDGRGRNSRRQTHFEGSQQTLASGYLRARTLAQLMVVQSRRTDARLEIQAAAGSAGCPRLTNRLGVDIRQLVLRDAEGALFVADSLSEGDATDARPIEWDAFPSQWSACFGEQRPVFPAGFDADQLENASSFFGGRTYYSRNNGDAGLPDPRTDDSILERGLRSLSQADFSQLPPRSYVAIVHLAPDLKMGIDSIEEEASFHVVQGSW